MTPWLHTTWRGGCNNAPSDVRGRVLAPPGAAAFAHPARVRRLPDGRIEAQWWDDYRFGGSLSKDDAPPGDTGAWRNFVARNQRIPEALLEQAQLQIASGAPAAGATLAPASAARATTHAGDCE